MPKRPPTSGYARIAQVEEEEEERYSHDSDDPFHEPTTISSPTEYAPIQPKRWQNSMRMPEGRPRRARTNSGVDIKAINARLERWAEEIKERFTIRRVKGKSADEERLEIHQSVFQAPDGIRPATKETMDTEYDDSNQRMSKLEFDDLVEAVRTAIELGVHPSLIAQGSSGSYFARTSGGKVVGVFKPKDEEPYANKNPKWTKWLHRNLLPFAFGRAMLIPNLSYVSEAAAYVLDCQLRTNIVPYTDVVSLSSKSFHYDWMDRRAYYRKKRPFPEKPGSFQVFLKGFKGATDFFQEHPWPDQRSLPEPRSRWDETCGRAREEPQDISGEERRSRNVFWTERLQQSFREELEKLVILDYVMRNTDRGTDNWMIRIDQETEEATVVGYPRQEPMSVESSDNATVCLGAIDNSLSWPWKHPDAWRSYPFGWLFLPVSLIGRPFSEKTRRHFLPLLTSKDWWSETSVRLRKCFELDADFQEKMFARQMAVMKGQAWNVVEALKMPDHGPLELTRRNRVMVWDDVVEIPVAVPLPRASAEMRNRAEIHRPPPEEEMDISAALSTPFNQPRPPYSRSHTSTTRLSHDIPRGTWQTPPSERRRRFSLGPSRGDDVLDDDGDLGYAAAATQESSMRKVIVERLEVVKSKQPFFSWC